MMARRKPSAAVLADYDISDQVGDLTGWALGYKPASPMYSYSRPAYMLWNAIAHELRAAGWTEAEIATWLKSKSTRYALDGKLGDAIQALGKSYAAEMIEGAA